MVAQGRAARAVVSAHRAGVGAAGRRMTPVTEIRTHDQLTRAVRQANDIAAKLRQGQRFGSKGELQLIATLLESLADVAQRGAHRAGVKE